MGTKVEEAAQDVEQPWGEEEVIGWDEYLAMLLQGHKRGLAEHGEQEWSRTVAERSNWWCDFLHNELGVTPTPEIWGQGMNDQRAQTVASSDEWNRRYAEFPTLSPSERTEELTWLVDNLTTNAKPGGPKLFISSATSPYGNPYGVIAVVAESRDEAIKKARETLEEETSNYVPMQKYIHNLLESLDEKMEEFKSGVFVDYSPPNRRR